MSYRKFKQSSSSRTTRMVFFRALLIIIYLLLSSTIFATGRSEVHQTTSKLQVIASTSIIADVVKNIAGNAINLEVIIKAGNDPHHYNPSPQDIIALETADIIFTNGYNYEEGLLPYFEASEIHNSLYSVSEGIIPLEVNGQIDPHVWFDPKNVVIWSENIARILSSIDPDNTSVYEAGKNTYVNKLITLDSEINNWISSVPMKRRRVFTGHNFLGYFALAYDIEIIDTIFSSTITEASTSGFQLTEFIQHVKNEGYPLIVLSEEAHSHSGDIVHSIEEDLRDSDNNVRIVHVLTESINSSEILDESDEEAHSDEDGELHAESVGTYIEFIRYTSEVIVKNLLENL